MDTAPPHPGKVPTPTLKGTHIMRLQSSSKDTEVHAKRDAALIAFLVFALYAAAVILWPTATAWTLSIVGLLFILVIAVLWGANNSTRANSNSSADGTMTATHLGPLNILWIHRKKSPAANHPATEKKKEYPTPASQVDVLTKDIVDTLQPGTIYQDCDGDMWVRCDHGVHLVDGETMDPVTDRCFNSAPATYGPYRLVPYLATDTEDTDNG